jgi:hypothetical protein
VGCGTDRRWRSGGLLQGATVLLRLVAGRDRGAANALVSTVELFGATGTVILALIHPCLPGARDRLLRLGIPEGGHIVFGRKAARPQPRMELEERWQGAWFNLGSGRPEPRVLPSCWVAIRTPPPITTSST